MPANLPPQYYSAKKRYELAKDIDEKIAILTEMQIIMPKHKGTNKLRAEIRSRLAGLRKEAQKPSGKRKRYGYHIPKQGAAQLALIGGPNVGKSSLLVGLTNADAEVAPYPFTTGKPVVGMMPFEDISLQLIDTPPITSEYIDQFLPDLLRRVDLILLVADIGSDDALDQVEAVIEKMAESRIKLVADETQNGGEHICKRTVIAANKEDLPESQDRLAILEEFYCERFPIITVSAEEESKLESLKKQLYDALGVIRIYTKSVGKKADLTDPVIIKRGGTVLEAAAEIHKEFFENLVFARIWGHGQNKYDGQRVSRDHPLEDRNILEFHISE